MATDLLMNACGDLDITEGKLSIVRDGDQVKQAWLIHMRTFLGEYFLDVSIGVPYLQEVFGKRQTVRQLKEIFIAASLNVPGIIEVTEIVIGEIEPIARTIDVSIVAKLEGNVTGVFQFTGSIPITGCEAVSPAQETGTPWFWFDPTNTAKSFVEPALGALEIENAFQATGAGSSPAGEFEFAAAADRILNNRTYFNSSAGGEMAAGGMFSPRASMYNPAPTPYLEALDVFMVLNPPTAQQGNGILTLLGEDDSGNPQSLVISLINGPSFYQVQTELTQVLGGGMRTVIGISSGSNPANQTAVLNVTFERTVPGGSPLAVTTRVDGEVVGNVVANVGLTTWQSSGGIYIAAGADATTGAAELPYEGPIGEVLGYREILTDAERLAVVTTLFDKWKE